MTDDQRSALREVEHFLREMVLAGSGHHGPHYVPKKYREKANELLYKFDANEIIRDHQ